jgi:hypothetical protein
MQALDFTRGAAGKSTTAPSYLSGRDALRSPIWWAALLVLLLNDHVLKGAGLLPAWLTGKLSDVVGLVVAPPLLCALAGARSRRAGVACFAAVAAVFAVVKISADAAELWCAMAAAFGLRWTMVADPTDLVGLCALPLAWRLCVRPRAAAVWRERGGLVLGAVACIATSGGGGPATWSGSGFVVNSTGADVEVRLRYYTGFLECSELDGRTPRIADPQAFGAGITFRLAPGETLPVDLRSVKEAAGIPDFGSYYDEPDERFPESNDCLLVLVQAEGLPSTLLWWSPLDVPVVAIPLSDADGLDEVATGAVDIVDSGAGLWLAPRGNVRVASVDRGPEPSGCPAAPPIEWSPGTPYLGIVEKVAALPEGCIEISGAPPYGSFTYCGPAAAFPVERGDEVTVTANAGGRQLHGVGWTLDLLHVVGRLELGLVTGTLEPLGCAGDRRDVGGYSVPARLVLDPAFGDVALLPGESAVVPVAGGEAHVFVGRAEHVIAAPACETDPYGYELPCSSPLVTSADVAVLFVTEGGAP